uniref:Putative double-strand telomere binding protein 1 n=1 Tax=Carica papaya TaxID=3649 RepID=B5TFM5_CARPA|nr:putative double-strand telomere binding protein 1 [Carica papaya]
MVFKKDVDYGFNVPVIPRAPRSSRRRAPHKTTAEDTQVCAFELLASLAGKLLEESESSSASSNASERSDCPRIATDIIAQEQEDGDKRLETECVDRGSCEVSIAASESTAENSDRKCSPNEFPHVENDAILERTSFSGCLHNIDGNSKSNGYDQQQKTEGLEYLTEANTCHANDQTDLCMGSPGLISSDKDVNIPSRKNLVSNVSLSRHRTDVSLGRRDDDENFSRCYNYKFSNKVKAYRPPPRIVHRRIRKLLTSKYWKVAPKLKDYELSRADGGIKPLYHKRKTCYNRESSQHDVFYKKRKLSDRNSVVTSDGGFSSESVTNSPEKNVDKSGSDAMLHGVKFSIKSFRVPELFIEVPDTATVGSLKRTVMEAVTALVGGGIRVGVLVKGKKIRDDDRTLSQTGISCKDNLDALGFTLEPTHAQAPPPICPEDHPPLLPNDPTLLLSRLSAAPALELGIPNAIPDPTSLNDSGNHVDSNHEIVSSYVDSLTDKPPSDSRALVPVPAMSVEALAVVPVNQKIRKSELAQRRTRRPFSVSEVEALVQAVEELGTGRWRDVKLRAFEDADHRTYVDLKDKWKTLVHTATISPQQRRGEPVPQELLDRVLAAHSYWSQNQAKQGKRQAGTLKITDVQPGAIVMV